MFDIVEYTSSVKPPVVCLTEMFTVQEALISPFCGNLSAFGLKPASLEALFHSGKEQILPS